MSKEIISWKQKKIIDSLTPFTLLDFQKTPSVIVWFSQCNMRCSFCYNPEIVLGKANYSFNDIYDFFLSRKNLLKGVVLCGGEPTIHNELYDICKELKSMDYNIKLDTNGLNPHLVKILIDEKLIDFVALDFKGLEYNLKKITKVDKFEEFEKTLDILLKSSIDFEIRTTYHSDIYTLNDIYKMLDFLELKGYKKRYYLQNFISHKSTLGKITSDNKTNLSKVIKSKYSFDIKYRNF
jgi:pyruvate formate lyase activating enzyme